MGDIPIVDDLARWWAGVFAGPAGAASGFTNDIIYQVMLAVIVVVMFVMALAALWGKVGISTPFLRVVVALIFIFLAVVFLRVFWFWGQVYN